MSHRPVLPWLVLPWLVLPWLVELPEILLQDLTAFQSLAFQSLAFQSLAFQSLAFQSLAFRALAFQSLAFQHWLDFLRELPVSKRPRLASQNCVGQGTSALTGLAPVHHPEASAGHHQVLDSSCRINAGSAMAGLVALARFMRAL